MKKDDRKIAIYARKSKFTGKGESISNQIDACKLKIRIFYPDITDDDLLIYSDEGYSGGNTNRPGFQLMMNDIRKGEIKQVYTYMLDRISRTVADFAIMFKEFELMNVEYFSATESYETKTPTGKATMGISTVFAQLERETIAERIRHNMYSLAKTGRWLGGISPTGYTSVPVSKVTIDEKIKTAYKLDIVKKEADIVKLIYTKFLELHSLTQTETFLIKRGIKTKNNKDFTRFTIREILTNPVYVEADKNIYDYFKTLGCEIYSALSDFNGKHGVMAYNKTIQKSGESNKKRDYSEWIIAVGKHTPLIESDKWLEVQNLIMQNKNKSFRKPKSSIALLSGLLHCSDCGAFMRPKQTKRLTADGEFSFSYRCEMKDKSRGTLCRMKNPNGNELDKLVCETVLQNSEDNSEFLRLLSSVSKDIVGNTEEFEGEKQEIEKRIAEIDSQIENIKDSIGMTTMPEVRVTLVKSIEKFQEEKNQLLQRLNNLNKLINKSGVSQTDIEVISGTLKAFAESFQTLSTEEKRSILRILIRRIDWDGENVHIHFFGDGTLDESGIPQRVYSK